MHNARLRPTSNSRVALRGFAFPNDLEHQKEAFPADHWGASDGPLFPRGHVGDLFGQKQGFEPPEKPNPADLWEIFEGF